MNKTTYFLKISVSISIHFKDIMQTDNAKIANVSISIHVSFKR